jgi:hypothetical protein
MCPDTIAVAETQGLLFEYLSDLRAKFTRQKGKKKSLVRVNITAAIETGLKITEKGHKPNEVTKKVQRRSKKSGTKESFSSTCTTKPPRKNVTPTATTTGFEREIGTPRHQALSHMCTTNPTPQQVTPAIPNVFRTPTEYEQYEHQFEAAAQQPFGIVTGLQQPHRIFPEHHSHH